MGLDYEEIQKKICNPDLYVNGRTGVGALEYKNWRQLRGLVFDTETNGFPFLDEWEKIPDPDFRILSFYGHVYDNREHTGTIDLLINPGMPIDPKSTEIHGITDEMVKNQPTFEEQCWEIVDVMNSVDFLVAYNAPFDIHATNLELLRNGLPVVNKPFIDVLTFERWRRDAIGSGNKLKDIAKRFGVSTMGSVAYGKDKLHDASTDVRVLEEIVFEIGTQLPWTLGRTVEFQAELLGVHQEYLENKYRK